MLLIPDFQREGYNSRGLKSIVFCTKKVKQTKASSVYLLNKYQVLELRKKQRNTYTYAI